MNIFFHDRVIRFTDLFNEGMAHFFGFGHKMFGDIRNDHLEAIGIGIGDVLHGDHIDNTLELIFMSIREIDRGSIGP